MPATSDRYDSCSPAWSADGKWLYFLSDRNFESLVGSPWGSRQPEPFWDRQTKIYHVALKRGERSPFQPDDELQPAKPAEKSPADKPGDKPAEKPGEKPAADKPAAVPTVVVDVEGLETRLLEVPVPAGNYTSLSMDAKRLYFISRPTGRDGKVALKTLALENKKAEPETFIEEPQSYELSQDGKKILIRKGRDYYVVDAGAKAPSDLSKVTVPLRDWTFSLDPRVEWRQMFTEAWRLERDYFYDRGMHGLDWPAMRKKYQPLVDRVTDRAELSDIFAQMVAELSALHIFVRGGDLRDAGDDAWPASLGAETVRDEKAGGFRVTHVIATDPDRPDRRVPLARPGVEVVEGDVIESVNGVAALSARDLPALLRGQAGKQVLLRVKPKGGGPARDVIVEPITAQAEDGLRYDEWDTRGGSPSRSRARTRSATSICARWAAATWPNGCASSTRCSTGRASSSTCATTTAATSIPGSSAACCAKRGSTGSRGWGTRRGTCSSRSAGTWSCWWIRTPRPTARRLRKGSAAWASARSWARARGAAKSG